MSEQKPERWMGPARAASNYEPPTVEVIVWNEAVPRPEMPIPIALAGAAVIAVASWIAAATRARNASSRPINPELTGGSRLQVVTLPSLNKG
jgi:hypothetical protein